MGCYWFILDILSDVKLMVTSLYTSNTISIKGSEQLRLSQLVDPLLKGLKHFFNSCLDLFVIRLTVVVHTVTDHHVSQRTQLQLTLTIADELLRLWSAFTLQEDVSMVTEGWLHFRLSLDLLAHTDDAN